jgi:hypothetical protein
MELNRGQSSELVDGPCLNQFSQNERKYVPEASQYSLARVIETKSLGVKNFNLSFGVPLSQLGVLGSGFGFEAD